MEWVETTGRTVDEAKSKALDQLGVAEDDAEIVVLEEPRAGLFGRVRGEARIRARVRPTQPRPKLDRRERKKKADSADRDTPRGRGGSAAASARPDADDTDTVDTEPAASETDEPVVSADTGRRPATRNGRGRGNGAGRATTRREDRPASDRTTEGNGDQEAMVDAQQVGDEAKRFVDGVVEAFGLAGTVSVRRDDDDIEVSIDGADLGVLVGPRGSTLQALQELTRVAAQRRLGDHDTRLRVDVGGYRERRREALGRFAVQVAAQVVAESTAKRLEPMSSSDRKVIHDVLATYEGVVTRSEGDDPQRCVVIAPADA